MNNLIKYLEENFIKFKKVSDNIVEINSKTYQLIYPENGVLFDELFEMVCSDTVEDNYIFEFGGRWYHSPAGSETEPQLNPAKYIGKANIEEPFIPWLGIHGKYEILNGSRSYGDWCKKAKFLQSPSLGICELNTLAGVIQFQESCKDNDIKSIIGASYVVINDKTDYKYRVKLYVKNEEGWQNILKINKAANVDFNKVVPEKIFWENLRGLVVVLDPKFIEFDYFVVNLSFNKEVYYQLDTMKFENKENDINYLENLGKFIQSNLKPILIQDSYYLDKEEANIKSKLNAISGVREFGSKNQHFKTFDEIYDELDELFSKNSDTFEDLMNLATSNLFKVSDLCNFSVGVGKRYLPNYIMNDEENKLFKSNRELFDHIIEEGFKIRVPKGKEKEYRERLNTEIEVIEFGDVVDYFLILWDIVKWCNSQDILVGIGRGSSGGSLVAYLMMITKLDPIVYGLLFERFLNKGRIGQLVEEEKLVFINGKEKLEYFKDDKVEILRDSKKLIVLAEEILQNDEIIVD